MINRERVKCYIYKNIIIEWRFKLKLINLLTKVRNVKCEIFFGFISFLFLEYFC